MFLTNHVLTGIALGHLIESDLILAPAAFSSHFFMDALPHFGYDHEEVHTPQGVDNLHDIRSPRMIITGVIDVALSLSVLTAAVFIWPERALHLAAGAFFAALPDLFYIPEIFFGWRLDGPLRVIHWKIQWYEHPPGILTEGAWAALMLYILRSKM